ncbi:MAG: VOC family protein [Chloroflexi bacterium]|nr:VOC family protein [Chloroflexota bacterium]
MAVPHMRKLNHVGIAVRDIDAAIELYRSRLGLELESKEVSADGVVAIAFIPIGDTLIELVSPAKPEGRLHNYIEQWGERIHHIAFEVDDVQAEVDRLRGLGIAMQEPCPRRGASGTSIAFAEPTEFAGALVELVQETRESMAVRNALRRGRSTK